MYDWNLVRDMRRELEQRFSPWFSSPRMLPSYIYSINLLPRHALAVDLRALVHMAGSKVTFIVTLLIN